MTTLQFADTHNLVAFLSKPAKSEGFEQIMDFLNANPIRYALTINPTIYTLCIEQFWATIKVKTVNGEIQLQALVDGKKIIVTEASVRRDLQLNDEEGTDCFPNATIFEELTRMGYEKLSQKLTFYKALFSPQWKSLIHTILQCLSAKTTAWNKFSSTMASAIIYEAVYEEMDDSLERAATTATSLDAEQDRGSGPRRQETMGDTIAQTSLKRRVKRLEKKGGSRTHRLKRLYKVGFSRRVESSDEEGLGEEDASKQRRIANIDADAGINLVSTYFDADTDMFGVHDLVGDEVVVERCWIPY
ncbi:hypothetical protein Tco_0300534 [Tanacetum coccineum]